MFGCAKLVEGSVSSMWVDGGGEKRELIEADHGHKRSKLANENWDLERGVVRLFGKAEEMPTG